MNLAGLLGILAAVGIAVYSILDSTKNPIVFANVHAVVLVVGGTITVALLSFNFRSLAGAAKIIIRKVLGRERIDYLGAIENIVEISEAYRKDSRSITQALRPNAHPFLKDGVKLLADYGFNQEELDDVLSNALRGKRKRDEEETKVWQTMARFPPAFGLLGATLGMIGLLETLGEPGAQDRIGPAMAVALVATFYGLAVANLVLIPLSEKLQTVSQADLTLREIIKEGVLLVQAKKHPVFIKEYLQSFLPPHQREDSSAPVQSKAA
ncbi:motility protein A [Bdellovibrio bacteriovorus]|uniref:Motility protein A n=1 Tax=Bdellovibrio bacteriovorus TaxID=959 RepID=A0A1Z3NC65_BDEBC|nr:MotA/TolQ/ExbB proton channel family protein [Bdellovibrio bacteriovorus]ASD65031.1 motility protein A [Bdellovibrio bacteriovorus]